MASSGLMGKYPKFGTYISVNVSEIYPQQTHWAPQNNPILTPCMASMVSKLQCTVMQYYACT